MKALIHAHRWPLVLLALIGLTEAIAVAGVAWLAPQPFSDEVHFITTIERFGRGLSLDLLRTYNDLSTPLTFWLYAQWGRVFGFELWSLRLCSVVLSAGTLVLMYAMLSRALRSEAWALFGTAALAPQPYTLAVSALVYTDISAMLFVVAALLAWQRGWMALLAVAMAGAVLCRQYCVFLPAAVGAAALGGLWAGDREHRWRRVPLAARLPVLFDRLRHWRTSRQWHPQKRELLAAIASLVPLAMLALLWGGLSPDNELKARYRADALYIRPASLVLYITLIPVFAIPVLIAAHRAWRSMWAVWLAAGVCTWLYWIWPVSASPIAVDEGIDTVGLFHRLLRRVLSDGLPQHLVWFVCFGLGLAVVFKLAADLWRRLRTGRIDWAARLDLAGLVFLLIMPWSYLHWEKYFLPLLPVLIARVLMMRSEPTPEASLEQRSDHA